MFKGQKLPPHLLSMIKEIEAVVKSIGLDPYDTVFELVDYKQLNEIASYGGFPSRYPHWRWGMEYERLSKSYTYGLSVIYEMVINNDPCYAYLLQSNNLTTQKTVIAHVYGHCDFFKHNAWFKKTNRKMLDQMANHATIIKKIIDKEGYHAVESFIDSCLCLENLIDHYAPFVPEKKDVLSKINKDPCKSDSKSYMDNFVLSNSTVNKEDETAKNEVKDPQQAHISQEKDILLFLMNHAPLEHWQYKILSIIRDEAYYFAPQGQTKILNEGWATYWHSKMMTEIFPLKSSEIVDYCDQYSGIVFNSPMQLNPYKLGLELLRHIEHRWDTGKFGLEYLNCKDFAKKEKWFHETNLGKEKLFEVRKIHNDITFIDEFLDEDFCHRTKLFLYDKDPRTGKHIITSKDFNKIKKRLLLELTNIGQPLIKVIDNNFKNRNELLLRHSSEKRELRNDFAAETLRQLQKIWKRPVHIETIMENIPRRLSFDGNKHFVEKL